MLFILQNRNISIQSNNQIISFLSKTKTVKIFDNMVRKYYTRVTNLL